MSAVVFAAAMAALAGLLLVVGHAQHRPPVHERILGGYEVLWRVGQVLLLLLAGLSGLALLDLALTDPAEAYATNETWLPVALGLGVLAQLAVLWLTRCWPRAGAPLLAIYAVGMPFAVGASLRSSGPAPGSWTSEDFGLTLSIAFLSLPLLVVALLLQLASNGIRSARPTASSDEGATAEGTVPALAS